VPFIAFCVYCIFPDKCDYLCNLLLGERVQCKVLHGNMCVVGQWNWVFVKWKQWYYKTSSCLWTGSAFWAWNCSAAFRAAGCILPTVVGRWPHYCGSTSGRGRGFAAGCRHLPRCSSCFRCAADIALVSWRCCGYWNGIWSRNFSEVHSFYSAALYDVYT